MTQFLSPQHVSAIVARRGLAYVLREMARYIEDDFRRWPQFDKCARVATHSDVGVIELMPIADSKLYAFKYVNGHPANTRSGLPTVMAFGALAEVGTGKPVLLSELTLTTALRTAATSVMIAQQLARPNPRVMALIGNGSQSEFQALAFHHVLGIRHLKVFDIDPDATSKLLGNLRDLPNLTIEVCSSTAEAVYGADIVTTVTADKAYATILTPDMIDSGMHINAVGGDCPGKTELHRDILSSSRVFVEFEPQSRIEGDVQQMPPDFPVTEVWRMLNGEANGRVSRSDVTVFDSVGFALEDYSALRFLRDEAAQLGYGESIELTPDLKNPKNLFSVVRAVDEVRRYSAEIADILH